MYFGHCPSVDQNDDTTLYPLYTCIYHISIAYPALHTFFLYFDPHDIYPLVYQQFALHDHDTSILLHVSCYIAVLNFHIKHLIIYTPSIYPLYR